MGLPLSYERVLYELMLSELVRCEPCGVLRLAELDILRITVDVRPNRIPRRINLRSQHGSRREPRGLDTAPVQSLSPSTYTSAQQPARPGSDDESTPTTLTRGFIDLLRSN